MKMEKTSKYSRLFTDLQRFTKFFKFKPIRRIQPVRVVESEYKSGGGDACCFSSPATSSKTDIMSEEMDCFDVNDGPDFTELREQREWFNMIQKDNHLLMETQYRISRDLLIVVGLSINNHFTLVIKFINPLMSNKENQYLALEEYELCRLMDELRDVDGSRNDVIDIDFCKITSINTFNERRLCIENGCTNSKIYLDDESLRNLLEHEELIAGTIEYIIEYPFNWFYNCFFTDMKHVLENTGRPNLESEELIRTIKTLVRSAPPTFKYCMLECLHYAQEKVLDDIKFL